MGLPVSESLIRPVIERDCVSVRRVSLSVRDAGCWKTPLYPDLSALISTVSFGASSQWNRPSPSEARKTPSAGQPRQVSISDERTGNRVTGGIDNASGKNSRRPHFQNHSTRLFSSDCPELGRHARGT